MNYLNCFSHKSFFNPSSKTRHLIKLSVFIFIFLVGIAKAKASGSDLIPPTIVYTPIANTPVTSAYVLNAFATITDASEVDTTIGLRPRLYYKKASNQDTLIGNTSADDGWKYVEASNSASPFSFNIDFSILYGGSVSAGDMIRYFIVAQDLSSIPNVAINSGILTIPPTSVSLADINFPITGTINSFAVVNQVSGTYAIGTSLTFTSLTNPGGFFDYINNNFVSGNITATITDDLLSETGAIALNQTSEYGGSGYTISILPSDASVKTISGSYNGSLIRLYGADRVTIDGAFNGSGSYLNFINTANSGTIGVIGLISIGNGMGATNDTIMNCTLNALVTGINSYGITIGSETPGTFGADNYSLFISGNQIKRANTGIFAGGTSLTNPVGTITISGNTLGDDTLTTTGIQIANATDIIIDGNKIRNILNTGNVYGIKGDGDLSNITINANSLFNIGSNGNGGFGGKAIQISVTDNSTPNNIKITNNSINRIWGDGADNPIDAVVGMSILSANTVKIYNNSVALNYSISGNSTSEIKSASLYIANNALNMEIVGNIFSNTIINPNPVYAATSNAYSFVIDSTYSISKMNFNDYYVEGSEGVLCMIGRTSFVSLNDYKSVVPFDSSISRVVSMVDTSGGDLHLSGASLGDYYLRVRGSIVTTDIDGQTRNVTFPYMGSDASLIKPLSVSLTFPSSSYAICIGNSLGATATFTYLSNPSFSYSTGLTYLWSPATGLSDSTVLNPVFYTPLTSANYSLTATDSAGFSITANVLVTVNPLPGINFTGTPTVVSGSPFTSVSISGSGAKYSVDSITGYTYTWNIVNGTIASGTGTHSINVIWDETYGTIGKIILTEVNTLTGCIHTDSILVNLVCSPVSPNYTATTLSLPTTFCAGATFTYAVTPISGYHLKWVVGGGSIVGSDNGPSVTVLWGGASTTASIKVTDSNGCAPASNPINITINGIPSAIIAGPSDVCANSTQHYSIGSISGSIITYNWIATGGSVASGQGTTSVNIIWGASGSGNLVCNLMSTSGCAGGAPYFPVTINATPSAAFTGSTTVCAGSTYTYSAVSSGNTYNWNVNGGSIITQSGNSVTVLWSIATNASLELNEALNNGCAGTFSQSITVNGPLGVAISGVNKVCNNSSNTYTFSGATCTSWSVTGGSIISSTGSNALIIWNTPGTQSITATYLNSSCTFNDTYNVTVNDLPTPSVSGANTVCSGNASNYTTTNNSGRTFNWNVSSGGTITSGQGSNTIAVLWNTSGMNTVTVTETINTSGCTVTSSSLNVTVTNTPDATVTGSTNVCSGGTDTYSAPVASSYLWNVIGGTLSGSSTTSSITVIWGSGTNGSISLQTTNGACSSSSITNIFINATPAPVISGPGSVCSGSVNTFTAAFNSNLVYSWSVINGTYTTGVNTNIIDVIPNTGATSVIVQVSASLNGTGCSGSTSKVVAVNPLPTFVVNGNQNMCQNASQTYSVTGTDNYSFSVTGGVITTSTATTATVTWASANGSLRVIGTNLSGCSSTFDLPVTVNPLPATIFTGASQVCTSNTNNYMIPAQAGTSYVWVVNGGTIIGGNSGTTVTVAWGAAGAGTAKVTATSASGCSDSRTMNIAINPQPTPSLTGAGSVCQNSTQTYSIVSIAGAAYNWSVTGGNIISGSGTSNIQVLWTSSGTNNIGVSQSTGLCMASTNMLVNVNAVPAIPAVFKTGNVLSTNAIAISYQWYKNGIVLTGFTSKTLTVTAAGTYYVEVTNALGCVTASNAITMSVGINEFTTINDLIVYPNPATSNISIAAQLIKPENVTVNLFDVGGKLLYTNTTMNAPVDFKNTISLEGYACGVYFIQMITGDNVIQRKIVKE